MKLIRKVEIPPTVSIGRSMKSAAVRNHMRTHRGKKCILAVSESEQVKNIAPSNCIDPKVSMGRTQLPASVKKHIIQN